MTKSPDNFWAVVNAVSRSVSYCAVLFGFLGVACESGRLLVGYIEDGSSQRSGWDMGESIIAIVLCGALLIVGFFGIRARPYVPSDRALRKRR